MTPQQLKAFGQLITALQRAEETGLLQELRPLVGHHITTAFTSRVRSAYQSQQVETALTT